VSPVASPGIYEFRMPSLGADMEAGTLMQWLVVPGDRVERGATVAVVDTEKADIEVEIFASGVVEELLVPVGEKVPVGTPLALVRTDQAAERAEPGTAIPEAETPKALTPAPETPAPETPAPEAPAPEAPAPEAAVPAAGAPPPSPAAPPRARDLGFELAALQGSGPGGAITVADVEEAVARKAPEAAVATPPPGVPAPRPPERGMRRALAAAMERANREIPHYYLTGEIDLDRALAWLAEHNARRPVNERVLPAAALLKAVALAAREAPELNGYWIDGAFRPGPGIHLGVAISRKGGEVVVPALHDADARSLDDLMAALRDLVQRARAGSLRSSEVADATLTVTNLGDLGAWSVLGVIYPPQVALVGFGRIEERPCAVDGMLAVRPRVTATLAADHRASDGFRGGRFLQRIGELLQEPEAL
jgi:pyruvate dehydrogenase E2 component (dihydrolipoamide acetyltransferase)